MQYPVTISRRTFNIGLAAGAAVLAMPSLASRVVASQVDLASLGLPTLDIAVTANGYEGVPETLAAGRYLLNLTVAEEAGFGAAAFLSPFSIDAATFIELFASGPAPEASPVAEAVAEASPAAEEEGGDVLPAFVYQSRFAGGAGGGPGVSSAVIDLPAGDWVVWGDDPSAPVTPIALTVTGDFPEVTDPESDITVSLLDFEIWVNGALTAGDHTVKVEHLGAQPHFLSLVSLPDGTTNEDLTQVLEAEMTGGALPEGLNPETDIQDVAYTPTQSIDTATWHNFTLEAGTYGALCFFPRAGVGDPHAFHGMHIVFVVE
jgi:hypothetical protein